MAKAVKGAINLASKSLTSAGKALKSAVGWEPQYKILFIGETGSGKTSFLNLICNYNLVLTLGYEAGVEQFHNFNNIKFESDTSKMESKTNNATMYKTKIENWPIGIIDTPGFGDSRGMEEDKNHVVKIITSLKDEEYINCVCLVINGRAARMSGSLKYVLSEVTSILPKSVINNVIVVFTNTTSALHLTFDVNELTKYFGCEIQHYFCIENPYCLYEKAKERQKSSGLPTAMIAEGLKDEFEKTANVLDKLFKKIKSFDQVHTNDFTRLYEKKKAVEKTIITTLAEYNNQTVIAKAIDREKEKYAAARQSKSLYQNFESEVEVVKQIETDDYNTLCGFKGCYTVCHFGCSLPKSFDKEVFKRCYCMNGGETCVRGMDGQKPNGCGHSYRYHYHNEVRFERVKEKVIDNNMRSKFENAKGKEQQALAEQKEFELKKKRSEDEKQRLSQQLVSAIEEFQTLGISRSYLILLENQLYIIEQYLEAEEGDKQHLRKTKEDLEKKIKVVKDSRKIKDF